MGTRKSYGGGAYYTHDNDDYKQQFIELKFHDRLSIADAIVLVQFLGLTKAAAFISEVDPWLPAR